MVMFPEQELSSFFSRSLSGGLALRVGPELLLICLGEVDQSMTYQAGDYATRYRERAARLRALAAACKRAADRDLYLTLAQQSEALASRATADTADEAEIDRLIEEALAGRPATPSATLRLGVRQG